MTAETLLSLTMYHHTLTEHQVTILGGSMHIRDNSGERDSVQQTSETKLLV